MRATVTADRDTGEVKVDRRFLVALPFPMPDILARVPTPDRLNRAGTAAEYTDPRRFVRALRIFAAVPPGGALAAWYNPTQ